MIKTYATVIGLFFTGILSAQNLDFEWAKQNGGADLDQGRAIHTDASGNVYIAGNFEGTADFDPGVGQLNLTSFGGKDIFVQKLAANGDLIWTKHIGKGNSEANAFSVSTDASGNVYTTGVFQGTAGFDPNGNGSSLVSAGGNDIFIHKMSSNGDLVWVKQIGGVDLDEGRSILDANGDILVVGSFMATVDFDPNATSFELVSAGETDIFTLKLDSDGNFIWANRSGGSGFDGASAIDLDASGNIYTVGNFESTVDFDPGAGSSDLTSNGISDVYIQKLDANGNFIWAKQIGGSLLDFGNAISVDENDGVYITGSFFETVDFNPGTGMYTFISFGADDVFILKLDHDGDFVWANQIGSVNSEQGLDIEISPTGHVITSGAFQGSVDFDPSVSVDNLTSNGDRDIFMQILNSDGNYLWTERTGGSGWDIFFDMSIDNNGDIYSTGAFPATVDFDPSFGITNLSSSGSYDVFVQKLNSTTLNIPSNGEIHEFSIYPNPTSDQLSIVSLANLKNFSVNIVNAQGKSVFQSEFTNSGLMKINLDIPNGMYILEISCELGVEYIPLVKL